MSDIIKEGDNFIVKPDHDIVASMANEFRSDLHDLVQEKPKMVIIDLKGVGMVDSVGIGVLIATHNSMVKAGGEIKVINASSEIYTLFHTMRLNRHFTVETTA